MLTFPVFNYQLVLCWVYMCAHCGLFMCAVTSLDFNEWTRRNSLESPPELTKGSKQSSVVILRTFLIAPACTLRSSHRQLCSCVCSYLGNKPQPPVKQGMMVRTGSSLGSLHTAVTRLKQEAGKTSNLAHAYTTWVVIRNALLALSSLRTTTPVWSMATAGVHVPSIDASLLMPRHLFRFQLWPTMWRLCREAHFTVVGHVRQKFLVNLDLISILWKQGKWHIQKIHFCSATTAFALRLVHSALMSWFVWCSRPDANIVLFSSKARGNRSPLLDQYHSEMQRYCEICGYRLFCPPTATTPQMFWARANIALEKCTIKVYWYRTYWGLGRNSRTLPNTGQRGDFRGGQSKPGKWQEQLKWFAPTISLWSLHSFMPSCAISALFASCSKLHSCSMAFFSFPFLFSNLLKGGWGGGEEIKLFSDLLPSFLPNSIIIMPLIMVLTSALLQPTLCNPINTFEKFYLRSSSVLISSGREISISLGFYRDRWFLFMSGF